MFTEILICVIVITALIHYVSLYFKDQTNKPPPVPFVPGRIPFIGHAWNLDMTKPHLTLAWWAKKYGSVFKIQLYNEDILVLNDYMSIYEALVVNSTAVSGRPPMYRTAQNDRNKESIVWQTYTPKLMFLRKEVHKSFKIYGQGLEQLEYLCKSEIQNMIRTFQKCTSSAVNPHQAIYDSVCKIMLDLILGQPGNSQSNLNRIKELNVQCNDVFASGESRKLDLLPLMRYFGNHEHQLTEALKLRDDIWNNDIKSLLKTSNTSNSGVIQNILKLVNDPSVGQDMDITENTVKEVFTNLILAGTDTTATSLTSLLLIFLHYPQIQEKMYQEIVSVIGTETSPSLLHRTSFPYCEAVLLELLRYISHVPLAIPHYTIEDTVINSKLVHKGTTVYINLWALHHDESIWPSPWLFNPNRFLDARGNLLSPGSLDRRRLMVFGAGRRVCLGETLAKNRLFLFATSIVQKLAFSPVDDNPPSCDPRTFDMGIVLHPKPFKLIIRTRNEIES